jgi:hypothetical protein
MIQTAIGSLLLKGKFSRGNWWDGTDRFRRGAAVGLRGIHEGDALRCCLAVIAFARWDCLCCMFKGASVKGRDVSTIAIPKCTPHEYLSIHHRRS